MVAKATSRADSLAFDSVSGLSLIEHMFGFTSFLYSIS